MKGVKLSLLICISLYASLSASAQKPRETMTQKQAAAVEQEVRQFFEGYAEDLRQQRRDAIADRYDRRGAYMMGNGQKRLSTFEELRSRYVDKWKGPKSFEWKDLSFEVLSPGVAVVVGRFEWQTTDGKMFKYSYTGVLTKREGQWRIRVEDESTAQ